MALVYFKYTATLINTVDSGSLPHYITGQLLWV